jgi:hypothetical protein
VTILAISAIIAFVTIVLLVASIACFWRLGDAIALPMTFCASHDIMFADQWKCCVLIVIERRRLPPSRRVAFCTISSASPFMLIVIRMAGNACHARFFNPIIRSMTSFASNRTVLTSQIESGHRVVIERRAAPRRCVMTLRAIRAARTIMLVVLGVTGNTGARRSIPSLAHMATHTRYRRMSAIKRKAR